MQFSPTTYSRIKSRLKRRYQALYSKALKRIREHPKTKTALWLKDHGSELIEFTPLRWYFLKQVESLIFFMGQDNTEEDSKEFSPADDDLFERWNQSEFADVFLKFLNKGFGLRKASFEAAKIFDEHLVALGNIHLLKIASSTNGYRLQPSLGDIKKKNKVSHLLKTTLHLDGKELNLFTSTLKEMKDFSTRIEIASRLIKQFSPDSWQRFTAFTEVIIPIKDEELVSYSHQELPGTSMINLYHRDFVDLLDDLIHENGHHHLNYYLNLEKLIEAPIECIYYSPWRRSLRPLRGIYHAYFTFFWGFKLFSDMVESDELDSVWYVFSPVEKEKIIWRAIEEYWMLDFTFTDLQWAKKQGFISDLGWKIINEQRKKLLKFKKQIPQWEKSLKQHRKELINLKKTLSQARKHYKH